MTVSKYRWLTWAQYGFTFCGVVNSNLTISVILLLSIMVFFFLRDLETSYVQRAEDIFLISGVDQVNIAPQEFWDHLHDAYLMLNYQKVLVIAQFCLVPLSYTI